MKFETINGTFEAHIWHVGKHIAADPSGFNWRIKDDEIDRLYVSVKNLTPIIIRDGHRGSIRIWYSDNGEMHIHAIDILSRGHGTMTSLTNQGRSDFEAMLKEASAIVIDPEQQRLDEETHAAWEKRRDQYLNRTIIDKLFDWLRS